MVHLHVAIATVHAVGAGCCMKTLEDVGGTASARAVAVLRAVAVVRWLGAADEGALCAQLRGCSCAVLVRS